MLQELRLIRNASIRMLVAFGSFTLIFLAVPLPRIGSSVSEFLIENMRTSLIPSGSTLAIFGPLDAFFAQTSVATAAAVALLIPLLLFELWHFIAPALHRGERMTLLIGLVVSFVLALCGAVFAYFVLIPLMFNELYAFLPGGVVAYFGLREVVSLVTGFMVGCALMFLLPLIMTLLSMLQLVPPSFWIRYARFAALLVLVVSAIITPDGSGVGMILLSLPVFVLYGLGYLGSRIVSRRNDTKDYSL